MRNEQQREFHDELAKTRAHWDQRQAPLMKNFKASKFLLASALATAILALRDLPSTEEQEAEIVGMRALLETFETSVSEFYSYMAEMRAFPAQRWEETAARHNVVMELG
jgi:hypothetical protein